MLNIVLPCNVETNTTSSPSSRLYSSFSRSSQSWSFTKTMIPGRLQGSVSSAKSFKTSFEPEKDDTTPCSLTQSHLK